VFRAFLLSLLGENQKKYLHSAAEVLQSAISFYLGVHSVPDALFACALVMAAMV